MANQEETAMRRTKVDETERRHARAPEGDTMTTFLCIAPNYWGRGPTIADAKAQVKKEGGSLTRYMIFECDDPNVAVDELGYILYQRGATLTEVMRRPKRKGGDR